LLIPNGIFTALIRKIAQKRKRSEQNPIPSWNSIAQKIQNEGMASMISDLLRRNGKVVVLGASGQLGQMLSLNWPFQDELVCHSRQKKLGFITFDQLSDAVSTRQVMQGARAVVCLSGVTPRHAKQSGDAFFLNTDLALAAVRAARDAGVGRVFLASSAAVYGRASGVQDEKGPCEPVSDYGHAKLDMELAALQTAADLGQPATVLRIGNVAGADVILGGWHENMVIDALPNGRTPCRSYIGPQTLTHVIHQLTQAIELPDVINIAAPGTVEMGALLDAAELPWSPGAAPKDVIENVELSTKRLERHVGFAAQNSTAAGLVAEWRQFVQQD
jgi:nucleoside-diphosphate-sugar epimerase